MKVWKTVWAIVLCCVMVVALCACGKPEPAVPEAGGSSQSTSTTTVADDATPSSSASQSTSETTSSTSAPVAAPKTPAQLIVGKWRTSMDMAPAFAEQGLAVDGQLMVSCDIEFTKNGVLYEVIDRTTLKAAYTRVFTKMLNDSLAAEGITKGQFETDHGITFDEYVAQMTQAALDSVPQTLICAYEFRGNDLYVREQSDADFEKETYAFDGNNKLTLTEGGTAVTYTRIA